MTEYDNTNRGVLFRNGRKERDTHPGYNGSINIDGREYWLNAWLKEGQKGKFFSLAVKPKDEQPRREPTIRERAQAKVYSPDRITTGLPPKQSIIPQDDDEGIPF